MRYIKMKTVTELMMKSAPNIGQVIALHQAEIDRLRSINAELLYAVRNIAAGFGCEECTTLEQAKGAMDCAEGIARKALAKAKGE